jgi:hypothetical protein
VGADGRPGDGLVTVVHQGDEFADLLGDLIGLGRRTRIVGKGITNGIVRIGWFLQALMGGHGPKDVLIKL